MDTRYGRVKWGKGNPRSRTSAANWKLPAKWNRDVEAQIAALCRDGESAVDDDPIHRPRVFCASLSDWLDDEVPIEWLADLLKLIHDTPNLDWLMLTKRPENFFERVSMCYEQNRGMNFSWMLRNWLMQATGNTSDHYAPPENVWLGTSVENGAMADERVPLLLQIPAKVRFLSVEPMLGPITLLLTKPMPIHDDVYGDQHEYHEVNAGIHWVIVGGESGSKKRPFNCDWARSIRAQCEEYSIPFFFKQVDKVQPIPADLMVRQFPTA